CTCTPSRHLLALLSFPTRRSSDLSWRGKSVLGSGSAAQTADLGHYRCRPFSRRSVFGVGPDQRTQHFGALVADAPEWRSHRVGGVERVAFETLSRPRRARGRLERPARFPIRNRVLAGRTRVQLAWNVCRPQLASRV